MKINRMSIRLGHLSTTRLSIVHHIHEILTLKGHLCAKIDNDYQNRLIGGYCSLLAMHIQQV